MLGAQPPWTVEGRKAAIKEKLKRRYSRYLKIPEWTESELADYPRRTMLGDYIHEGVMIKLAIEQRLKW
jgi:hypothetical protein